MAGVQISVSKEFDQVAKVLQNLRDFVDDGTEMWTEIGDELVTSTQNRFDTSTGPDGAAWIPSQRAIDKGGKTLIKDTFLLQSITREPSPHSVTVGTNLAYGAIHQFGGKAGRRRASNLPARPYLGVSEQDAAIVLDVVLDTMQRAVSP